MNDCVFVIFLDEEYSYKMRLLSKPEDGKFSVSIRLPYDKRGRKLMDRLAPVLRWTTQVYDHQWAHGGSRKRKVCRELQKQVTVRQGSSRWLLDGVAPRGIGYRGEAGAPCDLSEIQFDFLYDTCTHLEQPALRMPG